jgi:hypothetical protein
LTLLLCLAIAVMSAMSPASGDKREPKEVDAGSRAEHRAETLKAERRRRDPLEREQRRQSRSAFAQKSNGEALDVAKDKHPATMRMKPWKAPTMREGERIDGFRGDYVAEVAKEGSDARALVESTLPLRAQDRAGNDRLLDYTLLDSGPAYVPDNPLVDVALPKQLSDGVRVGSLVVHPEGARAADAAVVDDKAFWGNVEQDTDFIAVPTPVGVETFHQLRSAESPETLRLRFDLPEGARLRESKENGPEGLGGSITFFEVVRGDERLARILPPSAWDADGERVEMTARAAGASLVLEVPHRDADVRYPLMVDPYIDHFDWNQNWPYKTYTDNKGWRWEHNSQDGRISYYFVNSGATYNNWGWGHYMYTYGNTDAYNSYELGRWVFKARGDAHIPRAEFGYVKYDPSHSYLEEGICEDGCGYFHWNWQTNTKDWGSLHYNTKTHCVNAQTCDWGAGTPRNQAVFQLVLPDKVWRGPAAVAMLGTAHIWQWDKNPPFFYSGIGHAGLPGGWTRSAAPRADLYVQDNGLGVKLMEVSHPSRHGGTHTIPAIMCPDNVERNRHNGCPQHSSSGLTYRTDDMPEGTQTVAARGIDFSNNRTGDATWQVRVDRTNPRILSLANGRIKAGAYVPAGTHELRVDAEDIGAGGAQNSGVRRMEYQIDGGAWTGADKPCGHGACTHSFSVNTSGLPDGRRTVNVRMWDRAENYADGSFTFTVDKTPPKLEAVDGDLYVQAVNSGRYDVHAYATDAGGSGVASAEVFVRDPASVETRKHEATQSLEGGSIDTTYTFDASAGAGTAEGRHSVRVRATDRAGNVGTDTTFDVIVDREQPTLTASGPLADAHQKTVDPGTYALDISTTDGSASTASNRAAVRSGMGQIDVFVDGELAYTDQQECADGSCAMARQFVFDTSEYDGGRHDVEIVATDVAGNERTSSLTVTTPCCLGPVTAWANAVGTGDVAFGDVDGDGLADLVEHNAVTGDVLVHRSDGQRFGAPSKWGSTGLGSVVTDLAVGDVTGDDRADVVVASPSTGSAGAQLLVLKSTGSAFAAPAKWADWPLGTDVEVRDLNGDGRNEVVGRNETTDTLTGVYSRGESFTPHTGLGTVPDGAQIHFADVDGDYATDLVRRDSNGGVHVSRFDDGSFADAGTWATTAANTDIAVADVDGDDSADLLIRSRDDGKLRSAPSTGEGFGAPVDIGQWDSARDLRAADPTGDGRADAVGVTTLPGLRSVYVGPTSIAASDAPDAFEDAPDDPNLDDRDVFTAQQTSYQGPTATTAQNPTPTPAAGPAPRMQMRLASQADLQIVERRALPGVSAADAFGARKADGDRLVVEALNRLKQAGVNVLRINVWWGHVQLDQRDAQGNPQFDWNKYDDAVRLARANDFLVHLTLTGNGYQNGFECAAAPFNEERFLGCGDHQITGMVTPTPAGIAEKAQDYGKFVRAAVKHFSKDLPSDRRVNVFSLWNEPNYAGERRDANGDGVPDPGGNRFLTFAKSDTETREQSPLQRDVSGLYRELYVAGYDQAKAENPSAMILFGELSSGISHTFLNDQGGPRNYDPFEWLERAVGPGVRTDGLAYHPYQHLKAPWQTSRAYWGPKRLGSLNRLVTRLADQGRFYAELPNNVRRTPQLFLTEFGYLNVLRPNIPSVVNRWHPEHVRSQRIYGGRGAGEFGALEYARRARARWMLFYQAIEAPPLRSRGFATEQDYGMLGDGVENPPSNTSEPGLGSPWLRPHGMRAYGKHPRYQRRRSIDNPQNRNTFCHIWKWALRERREYGSRVIRPTSSRNFECRRAGGMARHAPKRG